MTDYEPPKLGTSRWAGKAYPSRRPYKKNCDVCGTYYEGRSPWTCGRSCQYKLAQKRRGTPRNYKGGRVNHRGYIRLWKPGYPGSTAKGYILEHRWVMEQKLGRQLDPWEHVHHRNGVKDDNRPENLEIVTNKTHRGQVVCPHCRGTFSIH